MVSAPVTLSPAHLAPAPAAAIAPARATEAARVEISLRKVGVAYSAGKEGTKTVLANIDLEIPAGEFVVLLGETGCGKSTLLRLMLGQEFPTSGEVIVDGKPVKRIDSRTGYVPQKYSLFPDRTVLENVMYGPENARAGLLGRLTPSFWRFRRELREEAIQSLTRMGLRPQDMKKYPYQLSGGMQQRVAIAQALLMKPPVLLLDEAFSALDPSTRSSLQELLHSIWAESRPTVVFVTHNTTEALLLGTTLIVLGRHRDEEPEKSNVLVAQQLPTAQLPFAQRCNSAEFREQHEFLERVAFASSSRYRTQPPAQEGCHA
ncbi:ABC transporter ATP-binding protein [Terracidiphilus gabretensis]|uniref:ABC transporter ATP-binding protein n=1 Tax=Terracidiphilus gabretensis TaxID=1577687 RepID=UPI001E372F61|nr:ABC transporter ATP-binding protein [Terracidiphilus gabretensis]